jgi:hypothetical protein
VSYLADWAYADRNALTDAYDDLYDGIQDVPGGRTISESLETPEPELDASPEAFSATFNGSGCSSA